MDNTKPTFRDLIEKNTFRSPRAVSPPLLQVRVGDHNVYMEKLLRKTGFLLVWKQKEEAEKKDNLQEIGVCGREMTS